MKTNTLVKPLIWAGVIVAVAVVGWKFVGWWNAPPTQLANNPPPPPPPQMQVTSPRCNGEIEALPLPAGGPPVVINFQARCLLQWGVVTGKVKLIGPTGELVVGPEGGSFPNFWTESVQAVGGNANLRYRKIATDQVPPTAHASRFVGFGFRY
ncbi:hypothetical protein EXS62_03160 [Candidatus Kaiserbacteria bacterium]|nr:hypothetical protein [Candidatus Kaiserbacteria bacterium]